MQYEAISRAAGLQPVGGKVPVWLVTFVVAASSVFVATNAQGTLAMEGDVRLANGSSPLEGRVELWFNQTWRTVCNVDSFTADDRMRVVCRQLGYSDVLYSLYGDPYGRGEESVLPIVFNCVGNETRLLDCPSSVTTRTCFISSVICQNITFGCYDYPTYYDPESDQCVETCPSGTVGVVSGSIEDVTTSRARACIPIPDTGYISTFNATQYEFDVNVYAPVGTVVFTAPLLVEDPDLAFSGFIEMLPNDGLFSFNMENVISIYYASYFDGNYDYLRTVGNAITLTVTLNDLLNPTDNITTYRYNFASTISGIQRIIGYDQPDVVIYESTTFPPMVTIDEIDIVSFGGSVSLMCTARGSPSLSYAWITAKGLEISSDSTLQLTISDVSQYGIYTCEVTNRYGTGSATVEVIAPDCTNDGRFYRIGEQFQPNCSTRCSCRPGGLFKCIQLPCIYDGPTCQASGDPHYKTFDGLWHHFQGTCEYVLAKPCDSDDFIISAGNIGHVGSSVSCVGLMRISIPSEKLEILLERGNRGTITINDVLQPNTGDRLVYGTDTVEVARSGGYPNVFLFSRGLRLFWDGVYRVEITVSSTLRGSLCGLCGTYNGNKSDDLQTPDGVVVTSVDVFGDSWLVPDPACNGQVVGKRNAPGVTNCSTDPFIIREGQTMCDVLRQAPFTNCSEVVNVTQFIDNCEFDYCCCSDEEREDCYCDALSSYASACADAGVSLSGWRSPTLCPLPCSNGTIYQQCGPLCPQTCDNADVLCEGGCAEGCFCPVGQVLIEGMCVDEAACATASPPPPVDTCNGSDQQCQQYFQPSTTVHIEIDVQCDTSNDLELYCDIDETLNTVFQDLVMSSDTIKVCTHFSTDRSDTCVVRAFVLEQIHSTPSASQALTRQLLNILESNETLLMYEDIRLTNEIVSTTTSDKLLGLEVWAGALILAIIGLLAIGLCVICGLLITVFCYRWRSKGVKSTKISYDNNLDKSPLKSVKSVPMEMAAVNLAVDADMSNEPSEKKGSTEDLVPTVI